MYFRWLYILLFSIACLKLCVANLWDQRVNGSEGAEREKEEIVFKIMKYIGFLVMWLAPNARFIFAQDKCLQDSKRTDVMENTGT